MAFIDAININDLPISDQNDGDFNPLPEGWYQAFIKKVELKNTKSGTGKYFNLQLKIIGPTHSNRVVFGMITHKNDNETAERIGAEQLRNVMSALSIHTLSDTDQLLNGELEIKIGIKEFNGELKNEIKAYRAICDVMPKPKSFANIPASAPSTDAPAAPKRAMPAWVKK